MKAPRGSVLMKAPTRVCPHEGPTRVLMKAPTRVCPHEGPTRVCPHVIPPRLDGRAGRVLSAWRLPGDPGGQVGGPQLGQRGPGPPAAGPLPETSCSRARIQVGHGGAPATALSQRPPPGPPPGPVAARCGDWVEQSFSRKEVSCSLVSVELL